MKGIVFDIQYNALYDGGGIRSLVFFKGCPLRCLWCHNPESQLKEPQITYFAERCTGCGECVKACEHKALKMKKKAPVRDAEKCTVCGACAAACSTHATEIVGEEMTPVEIAEKVARDKPFYETSGGGMTITGGEATMQLDFLLETMKEVQARGIHTALETCGFFKTDLVRDLINVVDIFLFDLKHLDEQKHKELTGVSNKLILANFEKILKAAGPAGIVPRLPLIPGANADDKSVEAIADYLVRIGHPGPVHLMPYNSMAKSKWGKVGRMDEYVDYHTLEDSRIEEIEQLFRNRGLDTLCNH